MYAVIGEITLLSILGHVVLLTLLLARRERLRTPLLWNVLPLVVAIGLLALMAFPPGALPGGVAVLGLALTMTSIGYLAAFGVAVLRDATGRKGRLWLVMTLLWLLALVSEAVFSDPGWLNNLFVALSAAPLITVGGFALVGLTLFATLARAYLRAPLPELANRTLFWIFVAAAALMSVLFLLSGSLLLSLIGILLLTSANIGSVYAQVVRRILDIHAQIGGIARSLALLVVGAVVTWGTITLSRQVSPDTEDAGVFVAVLALAAAALYGAAELGIRRLVQRVAMTRENDLADAAQRYSRALASADDLPTLAMRVMGALQHELRAGTASLLTITPLPDPPLYEIAAVNGDGPMPLGVIRADSPLYQRLAVEQAPLTLYNLTYSADFQTLADDERALFEQLGMNAYAPVLAGEQLIGLLAVGTKAGDLPYSAQDQRLLATLAHQTAPALRHVALADTLAEARKTASALAEKLAEAEGQIETLESVKADFIAVASHELRTPLAQLSGNIDLLDALNQGGILDDTQTTELIGNLRTASERLETLVAAMLDASQIETGALELHLAPVTLEDVVRQAVEPLTNSIRQRRIGVAVTGLRDLPPLQADGGRLTLALRYVLLNAIKYTPDNGKVEVTARHEPATRPGQRDTLLLSVKDSGVGIDAANLELIFRKFYRAHGVSTHSSGDVTFMSAGPGLGLPIVKGIVEAHGGQVWAESAGYDPERCPGTTIFIRLPLAPKANSKSTAQSAAIRFNDAATSDA